MTDTADLIRMSITATQRNNDGGRVVLYLDESMVAPNRTDYLPVLNVEHMGGYYEFLEPYQEEFGAWFGPDYDTAQEKVDQFNAENGISPNEAVRIVGDSMFNQPQP